MDVYKIVGTIRIRNLEKEGMLSKEEPKYVTRLATKLMQHLQGMPQISSFNCKDWQLFSWSTGSLTTRKKKAEPLISWVFLFGFRIHFISDFFKHIACYFLVFLMENLNQW